jgi:hypothetical protein
MSSDRYPYSTSKPQHSIRDYDLGRRCEAATNADGAYRSARLGTGQRPGAC